METLCNPMVPCVYVFMCFWITPNEYHKAGVNIMSLSFLKGLLSLS